MANNYYRIGGHLINIITESRGFHDPAGAFAPFASERKEEENLLFTAVLNSNTVRELNRSELVHFEWDEEECTIYQSIRGYEIELVLLADRRRRAHMTVDRDFTYAEIESNGGDMIEWFFRNNFLMMLYTFSSAPHGTAMLHASAVTVEGLGYLFLGHSGTGKSTHSRLWLENIEGSRLLNDDNPIIRVADGNIQVYGSPWSGKTPCYINDSAEVGAFVVLEQAVENHIAKLRAAQSFACLLAATSCLNQHERIHDGICDTLTAVASTVPVFRLKCLPTAEAATICHTTVTGK